MRSLHCGRDDKVGWIEFLGRLGDVGGSFDYAQDDTLKEMEKLYK